MLEEKDQLILLEVLFHKHITIHDLKNLISFEDDNDLFKHLRKLERWGLMHGSRYWGLTYKGEILAKLLALLPYEKNYIKNLRSEIIEFEYVPFT